MRDLVPTEEPSLVGQEIAGRYQVDALAGEGGMGQVYRATHTAIQKTVAIKVLRGRFSQRGDFVARFQREAQSASRIKHRNIVEIFDFGRLEDGRFYLVLEYLEGEDLASALSRQRPLPLGRAVRIFEQACRALSAAHKAGVVHRDLKPENLFLLRTADEEDVVKIVDFGIAQVREVTEEGVPGERTGRRITREGTVFGTPEYMAPEQAMGKETDHRIDVYAATVILFEMLTGNPPFTGVSFLEIVTLAATAQAPLMKDVLGKTRYSNQLETLVQKGLSKEPDGRFANMGELLTAFSQCPEGAGIRPRNRGSERIIPVPRLPDSRSATLEMHASVVGSSTAEQEQAKGKKRSNFPIYAAAIALVVGLGSFFAVRSSNFGSPPAISKPKNTPARVEPTAKLPPPPTPTAEVSHASPAPSASKAALPADEVKLTITTQPPGAVISIGGYQVCDASPCEVRVKQNVPIAVHARKGKLLGVAKAKPQSNQKLSLALAAPRRNIPARPPPTGRTVKPARMCEVEQNGLKILRPCQ